MPHAGTGVFGFLREIPGQPRPARLAASAATETQTGHSYALLTSNLQAAEQLHHRRREEGVSADRQNRDSRKDAGRRRSSRNA